MAVIQKPDALSLSGNLKKFEVHSGATVLFMLKEGETVIYEGSYEPGVNGVVYIDVKDIIDSRLSFILSHSIFYQQTSICKSFTATIDGVDHAFTVLRGGIANLADSVANWLTGNFLTWQPTSKPVTYYSPEWITYYALQASNIKLKAYLPGDTEQIVTLGSCEAGKAFTCNVQYAGVAGLLAQQYPTHYDVWVEDLSGTRLSYIQRYLYSDPKSELEQWFLYENSLGGIDTIRAYGDTDFESVHTHGISEIDEIASEYRVDTERFYNKNTGYLDEYERRWLLDFFPSRSKYVHYNGAIRKIVVTEDDAKYAVSDLPSSYTFRYRFSDDTAGLLNLIRNEDQIPEVITIPNLESPDFSLPPRLSEYPHVSLHGGVIIPAFDPNSSTPTVTTLAAIIAAAMGETIDNIPGSGSGGQLVNVLKTLDQSPATDDNVFSSLRTLLAIQAATGPLLGKYLSRIEDDTAEGFINFLKGLITASLEVGGESLFRGLARSLEGIQFGESFAGGLAGFGGKINGAGYGELRGLTVWEFFKATEFIFNKVEINIGDKWNAPGRGKIKSVDYDINMIELDLEEGEIGAIDVDDICMGIFHSMNTEENATEDYDDSRGNRAYAGFFTSYFRIIQIMDSRKSKFRYELRPISPNYPTQYHPCALMKFTSYGNFTKPERQRSNYETLSYHRYLKDVRDWEFTINNIAAQRGDLSNLNIFGLQLEGYSEYINNVYFTGIIHQLSQQIQDELNKQQIGGKNLLREYDIRFGFKYWGGTGDFIEVDLDTLQNQPYLNVSPAQILWVFPEREADVNVESNTNWLVE